MRESYTACAFGQGTRTLSSPRSPLQSKNASHRGINDVSHFSSVRARASIPLILSGRELLSVDSREPHSWPAYICAHARVIARPRCQRREERQRNSFHLFRLYACCLSRGARRLTSGMRNRQGIRFNQFYSNYSDYCLLISALPS